MAETPGDGSHAARHGWRPRHSGPALVDPDAPGLRAHRHTPNRLHSWVFDQQRVWVDFWGNEIALGSMNDDCLVNVLAFVRADASRIRDIAVLNLVTEQLARLAAGAPSEPDVFRHAFSAYDVDAVAWLDQMPLMQALSKLVEKHGRGRRRRGRVAMNRNQAIFNDCGNYCDAISSVARATEMLCTELDLRAAEEIGT